MTRRMCAVVAAWAVASGCGRAAVEPPPPERDVRAPAVAGSFYSASPAELGGQVDALLREARRAPVPGGDLVGAVVPHAGYVFSARCAASVYALLRSNQFDRVIVIGPSHHLPFAGLGLPHAGMTAYRTPLGDVPIATGACARLAATPGFVRLPREAGPEHCLEVQLPFLQRALARFELVPILCGAVRADSVGAYAAAVAGLLDGRTLVLASSDFTHYGPNYGFVPFEADAKLRLMQLLDAAAGSAAALDLDAFQRHCRETGDTVCGERPIEIVIDAMRRSGRASRGAVLDRYTSGDVAGDYRNSVSYAAIGFFGGTNAAAPASPAGATERSTEMKQNGTNAASAEFGISAAGQKRLLEIARQSIAAHLKDGRASAPSVSDAELQAPAAVFVTLTQQGRLRGCIGTTEPRAPLHQAVSQLAQAAAFEDGRFRPLSAEELPRTHIEISVLSPLRRVKSADEIQPKTHGVVVRRGYRSGLFLPQVWEHFERKEDFMGELCQQKAGLSPDAWKDPATELYVFTVFAFEEAR